VLNYTTTSEYAERFSTGYTRLAYWAFLYATEGRRFPKDFGDPRWIALLGGDARIPPDAIGLPLLSLCLAIDMDGGGSDSRLPEAAWSLRRPGASSIACIASGILATELAGRRTFECSTIP